MAGILSRFSYRLLGSLLLLSSALASAESRVVVAVLDTGVNVSEVGEAYMCELGHVSFNTSPWNLDRHGHGTVISKIITEGLDPDKVCIWVVKWFDVDVTAQSANSMHLLESAARYVHDRLDTYKVKFINMSLTGGQPSWVERSMIKKALEKNVEVITCTGNNKLDISRCRFNHYKNAYEYCAFPASYASEIPMGNIKNHNFHIVGCKPDTYYPCIQSSDGDIVTDRAVATYINTGRDDKRSFFFGTSMSAAQITNFLLKKYFTKHRQ